VQAKVRGGSPGGKSETKGVAYCLVYKWYSLVTAVSSHHRY